ncbi:glycosyl hydrolase [Microbacterium sp.]|uniref:glycosyl hydrolase n=1 Tax=Microbacterium sp. TaxID=51671 RepID=UPI002E34E8FA|nr:glycosyl hydrolase [Microbacterium sp.]HEX5730651.1 glycosyl hydrolase [Microbacterium sp.]
MSINDDTGGLRTDSGDPLWEAFVSPPDEARPRAWWHWMDGNIDPAGIVRDLTWLSDAGIRGVQLFDGGMGVPLVVPEVVRPGSVAWDEAVDTAVRTAAELDLELAVATSSGWSAAGGPWVQPVDAMKKVVWSEAVVDGGRHLEISVPPLPSVPGLYQDCPRWAASDPTRFATDWVVLAFPHDPAHDVLRPDDVLASAPVEDWSSLVDDSFDRSLTLPRDPDAWSTAWIEQSFAEPVTISSVVVGLPGPRGFGAAPAPTAVLQASDDGVAYADVVALGPTNVPVRSATFLPVTATRFRLVVSGGSAADALPTLAAGVRLPPVLRRSDAFVISEFALRAGARVHAAETKAGFGVVADYFEVDTDPGADAGSVDAGTVIDVTPFTVDGVLRWDAPPGRWRILRMGASLTGHTNGPAPADSTGLEIDKLDGGRVAAYLDVHLRRFRADASADSGLRFAALLSDSIESGAQNWTDRILEHFRSRRGYDPLPRLPALAGFLIGGPSESDRFLYDYRRTLSELLAAEYYGTLAAAAHARGMSYYSEALEDGRPQLGDDLAMRSHADVPMGAMWTFEPADGPKPTYVADLKGASSVAHVYGKSWTGSEAFSSFGKPWTSSPRSLKHVADLQLALGVTRFCIHTSPHQPLAAPPPGIALAPFLGQAFTVHETWSDMARPWIDYLARCSALLSRGRPAVEIAVFIGEEAPVTGLFDDAVDTAVPVGFDFDYIGPESLAEVLRVEDGILVSAGADYRLLFLGGSSRRMTIPALSNIERLLDAGATVVGSRPESSPSLADDPIAFREVCDRIWAPHRRAGRILTGDLASALEQLGIRPALEVEGGRVLRIARLVDGRRVTFLANPSDDAIRIRILAPSASADLVGWDPVEVRRVSLWRTGSGFEVTLPPSGSLFVLEGSSPAPDTSLERLALEGQWTVELQGSAPWSMSPHPRLWTELDAAGRAFSGTGVYRHEFTLTATQAGARALRLELEEVCDIARVALNGMDCGVSWTRPFGVDITSAARPGVNLLEVHVATPWRNRLIAEAGAPSGEIFAPMTSVYEPTAAVQPAGLDGRAGLVIGY